MAAMNPPSSTAVVEVGDGDVERYEAAGWTRVQTKAEPKPEPKKSSSK